MNSIESLTQATKIIYENMAKQAGNITELLLDDHGQCIHVTMCGTLDLQTLSDVAKAFGDDNAAIFPKDMHTLTIVIENETHKELLFDNAANVKLSNIEFVPKQAE